MRKGGKYNYDGGYSSVTTESCSKPMGISKDLASLPFSPTIKIEANDLYLDLNLGQKRAESRKMAITFCIYQTCLDRGSYCDVIHIGDTMKLSPEKSLKSISVYSKGLAHSKKITDHHIGEVDPFLMIDYYCDVVLGLNEDDVNEIKDLYEKVDAATSGLSKKVMVASTVYYWIRKKGLPLVERNFAKVFPGVALSRIKETYVELLNFL
jgi:transcription initiation factor TFIIIB Brf1 subunit/transcription initiation factor TFIIB